MSATSSKINEFENWDCSGAGPHKSGDVKVMPMSGQGNLILCRRCWENELRYRRERNKDLGDFAKFDLPAWESGRNYPEG